MDDWLPELWFGHLIFTSLVAYLIYSVFQALYNISSHPLARFPGPNLRAAFYFPNAYDILAGKAPVSWHHLHEQYGEVTSMAM
ncbi:hypothetical protein NX059_009837 [Plenodomus lindquistii]|nr:hypothetical protein NX059_009837 [Plenodomus lindquistii]